MIVSKDQDSGFPWCGSVSPTYITTLSLGQNYKMENLSDQFRFPFNSTVSSPEITNWRWVYPPEDENGNSDFVNLPSNVAWVLGSNQVFDYLRFTAFEGSFYIDENGIGENSFWASESINTIYYKAEYSKLTPNPNNPNYIIYSIVFFDSL